MPSATAVGRRLRIDECMSDEEYIAVLKASYDDVPQSTDEIETKECSCLSRKLTTSASLKVFLEMSLSR
jgi:hypothetical protein